MKTVTAQQLVDAIELKDPKAFDAYAPKSKPNGAAHAGTTIPGDHNAELSDYASELLDRDVPEGERSEHLCKIICELNKCGFDINTIVDKVFECPAGGHYKASAKTLFGTCRGFLESTKTPQCRTTQCAANPGHRNRRGRRR